MTTTREKAIEVAHAAANDAFKRCGAVNMDAACEAIVSALISAGLLQVWNLVTDELPPATRPESYKTYGSGAVLILHKDRLDYPITAHMYGCADGVQSCGVAIKPTAPSKFDWISWYPQPGVNPQNPFGLKNINENFLPMVFGTKIVAWANIPIPPEST